MVRPVRAFQIKASHGGNFQSAQLGQYGGAIQLLGLQTVQPCCTARRLLMRPASSMPVPRPTMLSTL
jgi:hypothetical protein